jgi:hypothetical protein
VYACCGLAANWQYLLVRCFLLRHNQYTIDGTHNNVGANNYGHFSHYTRFVQKRIKPIWWTSISFYCKHAHHLRSEAVLIILLLFIFSHSTISRPALVLLPCVSASWPRGIFLLFLYPLTAVQLSCFALQMVQVIILLMSDIHLHFPNPGLSLLLFGHLIKCHDCYQLMFPQLLHIPLPFPLLFFFSTTPPLQ